MRLFLRQIIRSLLDGGHDGAVLTSGRNYMSLKVLALRVWRDLGLSRVPGMRSLRKALIPNTRSWDDADILLKGANVETLKLTDMEESHLSKKSEVTHISTHDVEKAITPAPKVTVISAPTSLKLPTKIFKKPVTATDPRVLAKVSYWSTKLIHISEMSLAAKISENSILIRNQDNPTENEVDLYADILQNTSFIAFRKRHLGIVDLESDQSGNTALKAVDDLTRLIERFVSKSKARLLEYGFLIAVNPQNIFPIALQQSSYVSKLICIYTPDFKGAVDQDCIEYADRIICPSNLSSSLDGHDIAGLTVYDDAEQMMDLVTASIQSFFPKEFNMLMPIWQAFERVEGIENLSLTKRDLVLKLNCSDKKAPSVTGTFSEYIDRVSKHCVGILASEGVCQRYTNLIENLDDEAVRVSFLKRAFRDGARCEIIYA